MSDYGPLQQRVGEHVAATWPGESIVHAAIGLSEEVGEVSRCVVKREHGTRGTPEQWTAELRKEVGQVAVVLLDIAHREGFNLMETMVEQAVAFLGMDPNHDPLRVSQGGST